MPAIRIVIRRTLLISPPSKPTGQQRALGQLIGASRALAAVELARDVRRPLLVLATDPRDADQLEAEIRYFAADELPVWHFVEWETLPWDNFSPHQDIVSQRLSVLANLPGLQSGIVVVSAPSLLQRLVPTDYVASRSLQLETGQRIERQALIDSLTAAGYLRVPQVSEHGEIAVRGSLLDIYPMGSRSPVRIDFFDDDIESLRFFDPDSQLTSETVTRLDILPAREVPLDADDIAGFRRRYRARFEGQAAKSRVYRDVSDGIAHGGIEYYLPLFFDSTATLFDYLPPGATLFAPVGLTSVFDLAWSEIEERHALCKFDSERPVLDPEESFHTPAGVAARMHAFSRIDYSAQSLPVTDGVRNVSTRMPPAMRIEARYDDAAASLMRFIDDFDGRILFTSDSAGRRESIVDLLAGRGIDVARIDSWPAFVEGTAAVGVAVAPIENGIVLPESGIAVIAEQQLFGEKPRQRTRKRRADRDPESIIRELNDLSAGSPVVHAEYGVGRYCGLITLETGGIVGEFLHLEYADGDRLYVPVGSLALISRYTGASPENAPLHKLGSDQWARAKQRAIRRIHDVAAELLDVYARRAARPGHSFRWPAAEYQAFENGFPFEPTEDQARTIDEVLADLASDKPMDRIVCGDVGFGKTEVALRATFAAVHGDRQVAILVPTTLLAQQHGQTFKDRFADWPVRIEILSRFRSRKDADAVVEGMGSGTVDVVIGTHRLLQHIR
ncbi:MAG TPA: CarD family transcriptional regulator, partial [Woeseiaceae bacterium]|nr:CarD family transcriptional regulator [Woeseiaceae bacterium]